MDDIERIAGQIERATDTFSQQPRFQGQATWGSFYDLLGPTYLADAPAPAYSPDSRKRDTWLQKAWRQEPRLAGVVNAVVLIDSNRGWTISGGRNQTRRYADLLHNIEGGEGWRTWARKGSLSYWCTDMGFVTELGREGRKGPLRSLYHVDPARCRLTGQPESPLRYYPPAGNSQLWGPTDFFRVSSLPSDDETFNGLGFSAVSRCIEITRVLYAVLVHDQELLQARAPRGLLLLSGISEEQWNQSLEAREANLDSLERRYYAGVQVLAGSGFDHLDAKLIGLSQLPAGFDAKVFVDLSMFAYALCFGYDAAEFWPVQFGSIGRGTETEMQHSKASGKGGVDFALAMQERLQRELPETVAFEFEQRDDAGELVATAVKQAHLDLVRSAYETGLAEGAPLLSRDEARSILAEKGVIPPEWTVPEEDETVTDNEDLDRAMERLEVRRAIERYPSEPIVQISWPTRRETVLYDPERGFGGRRIFRVKRADVLWKDPDDPKNVITEEDVDRAVVRAKRRVGDDLAGIMEATV